MGLSKSRYFWTVKQTKIFFYFIICKYVNMCILNVYMYIVYIIIYIYICIYIYIYIYIENSSDNYSWKIILKISVMHSLSNNLMPGVCAPNGHIHSDCRIACTSNNTYVTMISMWGIKGLNLIQGIVHLVRKVLQASHLDIIERSLRTLNHCFKPLK